MRFLTVAFLIAESLQAQTAPRPASPLAPLLSPSFAVDAPGTKVVIASKDEGRYEKGKWIADRRLNGDEAGRGLPSGTIGMLKVKVVRIPN